MMNNAVNIYMAVILALALTITISLLSSVNYRAVSIFCYDGEPVCEKSHVTVTILPVFNRDIMRCINFLL